MTNALLRMAFAIVLSCPSLVAHQPAVTPKPELKSYFGKTPKIDGVLQPDEWDDAERFSGVRDWVPQFSPVISGQDLALIGYVKHDGEWLYFAFDITDDLLYGIDTDRWLPNENSKAHELTPEGYPWFGDELEILINAANTWTGEEGAEGNGHSWQMVCNLTKSRLGGVGIGGLLEGEPRKSSAAWATYHQWIVSGAQRAAAVRKPQGKGYVVEWAIRFNPCLQMTSGNFYAAALGKAAMGLNVALGDLDLKQTGQGNFGNFHHEQWFSGAKDLRTQKRHWGTLWMMGTQRKPRQ